MMEHFQFAQPEWLYVLPFILCLLILRRRRGAEGSITYPTVRFIAPLARTPHSLAGPSRWRARKKWKTKASAPSTGLTS